MGNIRALIVDDEPLARERIRSLLKQHPDVEIVGECTDGRDAVEKVLSEVPNLVFLDVQLPELDGFGVLDAIGPERLPVIIFVTAYDQYALRAFDVHAIDYLLKPFDRSRFDKAVERARAEIAGNTDMTQRLLRLLKDLEAEKQHPERLVVRSGGRVFFLRIEEIDWVEAEANYVRVHVRTASYLLRDTMKRFETKLNPEKFLRIHRSTIVNTDRIKELQPLFHGEYVVILRDGTRLTASRGADSGLRKILNNSL